MFGRILGGAALTNIAWSGARLNTMIFMGRVNCREYVQRQRAVLAIALIYPIAVPAVCFVLSLFLRLEKPLAKPVAAIAGIPMANSRPPALRWRGCAASAQLGASATQRLCCARNP